MAISALTAAISGAFEGIGTGLWATGVNAQLGSASGDDLVLAGSSEYGDPYAAGSSAASQSQGRMINPLWIVFSSMCFACCSILLSLLLAAV
jgi:hypothetical protein